ncbi:unnamed protein product (macronuclear) [Paramecium tetraurelia]|uniref:EGF-like domain-containing protein n=1 Tax=Paramecium tetraurelia TaxID=5888 RepID=A0CVB4_PARTE|nr:uncharacterized protein GSPATT00010899001 [Paramecium tetraurelia]CAK74731.1 unnamed protein product [Paramecium tetraurelia]|eukprot:XP_001442128.1 hypothetical protein (macronuclear) [Paramecium tetraurelia strain d4-2]
MCLKHNSLTYAATLIKPVTIINSFDSSCSSAGECCACSKTGYCSQNQSCACTASSGSQMSGQTCLLNSTENAAVEKQLQSGADESLIASFSVIQVYDLLNRNSTLTYKQLFAIYELGITTAQSSVQQSEIYWFLKSIEFITKKLKAIQTLEASALQTFQIQIMDLIRSLMFKYIDLDSKKNPIFFEQGYFSAIVAKWKDTINYTTMKLNSKSIKSAQCEYKYKSVLIRYKLVLAVSNDMIDAFTNSTFTYNSTVIYCQFMDKYGDIYYPPSSEFHYWHYVPNFDYEPLLELSDVIGLGCFQIKQSNSVYGLAYNNQDCQYKEITSSRPVPYCQCNEPGITFVQVLWNDNKIAQLALAAGTSNSTNSTEAYGHLLIITYLAIQIIL